MIKKIILTALMVISCTTLINNYAFAISDNYWRLMMYQHISKDINQKNALTIYVEEGRSNNMKKWEYIMPDIGWKYKTGWKYLPATSLTYRHVYLRSNDEWNKYEKRYNLNLFFNLPSIKKYKLKNRIRFEYRDLNDWADWRIRNNFTIDIPYTWTKYKIQPHLIDELYYSFHQNKVSVNEVWLKFTARFSKNTITCLGYRWAWINDEPRWRQYHMITVGISILLP